LHAVTSVYKHTLTLCTAHCMLLPQSTNTHPHYALHTACCYLSLQTHTHTMHCSLHAVTSVYKHTPTLCTAHCMLLPQTTNTHSHYTLLTAFCYISLQTHTHNTHRSLHVVTSVYKNTLTLCTAHCMLLPQSTNTHSQYVLLIACCYISLQTHTQTMHCTLHAVTSVYKHTPTLCTAHCMLLPQSKNTYSYYALLTACCYLSLQTHTRTMHCSMHAVTLVYKHTLLLCTAYCKLLPQSKNTH